MLAKLGFQLTSPALTARGAIDWATGTRPGYTQIKQAKLYIFLKDRLKYYLGLKRIYTEHTSKTVHFSQGQTQVFFEMNLYFMSLKPVHVHTHF